MLKDGNVVHVREGRVLHGTPILIRNGKIEAVGGFDPDAVDAEVLSISGCTVTPGLIDAHVHLCLSGRPNCHLELDDLTPEENEQILRENLRLNLENGVTTVRDMGCRWEIMDQLRQLDQRESIFPSVQASGPVMTIPEGHGNFIGEVADSANAPDLIRRLVESGAEVVKLIGTGGNLSPKTNCHGTQYSDEEFGGIMETVRAAGLTAACHTHAAAAVEQCMRFGVRSIEHGSYMERDQALRLASLPDCYWVPTVCPGRIISGLSEAALDRVARRRVNIRTVIQNGGNLVAGTDAGIGGLKHGCLPYELDEFMDAGMSAMEALRSATCLAAEMMNMEGKIGTVEAGADADLLIFRKGFETEDFSFHEVSTVIKGGWIV